MSDDQTPDTIESIAIIGMAGRFPEARDLDELWRNLLERRDCIRNLTDGPGVLYIPYRDLARV